MKKKLTLKKPKKKHIKVVAAKRYSKNYKKKKKLIDNLSYLYKKESY